MSHTLLILAIVILPLTSSCTSGVSDNKPNRNHRYDTLKGDKDIGKQSIFRYMDDAYEPISLLEAIGKNIVRHKATSTVALVELKDAHDRIQTTDELRCRASITNDTLRIDIGFSTGFSGAGVSVKVADHQFSALPYRFYDVVTDEKEPVTTIEKQKLVLSKAAYVVGDSLYGRIYLRTIDSDTVRKYAQGFFRTIVSKE